jgi:hypothetical protein
VAVQAQQVAQQFGSAFVSAGRLASQLVRGLVTPPSGGAAQSRRTEERSTEGAEEAQGTQHSPEAGQGPNEAAEKSPLQAAFAALKRTRLFRFRKKRTERTGNASLLILGDDYDERERDHHRARAWLGDEQERTVFEEARSEALFLLHLERQGEPPTRLLRHLNSRLVTTADREFKHLLIDQVRPQMEALAGRVAELPTGERRELVVLTARAAYQVGVRSSTAFEKLLRSAAVAEAAELANSSEGVAVRAAQLERGFRGGASPVYRAALLEASRGSLEKLAGSAVGLAPQEQHLTWSSLLHLAEGLELELLPVMAETVVAGGLGTQRPDAAGTLAEALGAALKRAPGGGGLAVQLIVSLSARGEVKAAERLAGALCELLREARLRCIPIFRNLRVARGQPGAAGEAELLRGLEAFAPLMASLMPACAQVLEKAKAMPPGAVALVGEALLALASLDSVGATVAGQRVLRRTLLAQERGAQTFLAALPRVARTLAQPQFVRPLMDSGFAPVNYRGDGQLFLDHVATQLSRALAGPVLARSQKGDAPAARVLLRSALRDNAALFSLKPEGARLAGDALEALRDRPGAMPLQKSLALLDKIRRQHAPAPQPAGTEPGPSSINPLHGLATALAGRKPAGLQRGPCESSRKPDSLSLLEVAVDQTSHSKRRAALPGASAHTPASSPGDAPRSRK